MPTEEFSIINLLDGGNLPLKNRTDSLGYYAPKSKTSNLIPNEPLGPGEQYRFHFDMTRCIGCQCCVVACNEQNNNPAEVNWRRVGEFEGGIYPATKRYHLSMACNHCLDPSCLEGCPTDAYIKLENGVVSHKAEECIGCGYCSWNCPYGVPQFNSERRIVTKCDMCHNRLADGMEPACVAACPEEAIHIEKVNIAEWRANHGEADAPLMPDSNITISTTRITLPDDLPEQTLRANRHRIEPEQPHVSLIFMTVLTQLAAGGFLTLGLGDLLSGFISFLKPLQNFLAFGAWGMLAVAGLALAASVFHLGRPLHAYKALRMWKRSWLSREVLFFTLFSFCGAGFAMLLLAEHFFHFHLNESIHWLIGALVSFFGMAGIYASAKIYCVPARPAWNTIRTPIRFFLTGLILGPLFGLVLYAVYMATQSSQDFSSLKGPIVLWLAVSSTAAFFQLFVLLGRLIYLFDNQPELLASTTLLTHRFRLHFLFRIGLLMLGNFIIPIWIFNLLTQGQAALPLFVGLALSAFVISLASELLGRYLFFVTVVPKNMPGSFFTSGGAH